MSSILYQPTIKCSNNKIQTKRIQWNLRNDLQETLCKPEKIIELNL